MDGYSIWNNGKSEKYVETFLISMKERHNLGDLGVDGSIIVHCSLRE